ncbi:unnamed protein product [Prunus armeniaca]
MNLGYPFVATVTVWHDSVVACASGSDSSSSGVWILTGSVLLPPFQRLFQWCLNFYDWKLGSLAHDLYNACFHNSREVKAAMKVIYGDGQTC